MSVIQETMAMEISITFLMKINVRELYTNILQLLLTEVTFQYTEQKLEQEDGLQHIQELQMHKAIILAMVDLKGLQIIKLNGKDTISLFGGLGYRQLNIMAQKRKAIGT